MQDAAGWYYINSTGEQVFSGRFLSAEPHYNGQARVKLLSGGWAVVDEAGAVSVPLALSDLAGRVEVESLAVGYWGPFALKMILQTDLLGADASSPRADPRLRSILLDVAEELGLCGVGGRGGEGRGRLLPKGSALIEGVTADRCRYWLQDRYLRAWLPALTPLRSSESPTTPSPSTPPPTPPHTHPPDTFQDLSLDPQALALSHRVLTSYAATDWSGIAHLIPLTASVSTVVDIAGGTGSLLREVEGRYDGRLGERPTAVSVEGGCPRLICVERPEVVGHVREMSRAATTATAAATTSARAIASASATVADTTTTSPAAAVANTASASASTTATAAVSPKGSATTSAPAAARPSQVEFQEGDLFTGPLPIADLYLMSRVLHDW